MSLEVLSTAAAIGTFIVIAATAGAALVQLRHLRVSNQLQGLLTVLARVEDPSFNAWVDGARRLLEAKIEDPVYRRAIEDGTYDRENNPWLNLANSYEWVGSLVKNGLIPEDPFMDVYAGRVLRAWELIEDVTAILRGGQGPWVWENFEFIAVRAQMWLEKHPQGTYPAGLRRMAVRDRWRTTNAVAAPA